MAKNIVFYLLLFVGILCAAASHLVANAVTVRDISLASNGYTISYPTHGGTVYIDQMESLVIGYGDKVFLAIIVVLFLIKIARIK